MAAAPPIPAHLPATLAPERTVADYARRSLAPNTLRAYRADWEDFLSWCRVKGHPPLPAAPETVADYLASLAHTHGRAALRRRLAAITQAHKLKGIAWTLMAPSAACRGRW